MFLKKMVALFLVAGLLLTGCAASQEPTVESTAPTTAKKTIQPLPNTTTGDVTDAILAVSLEEGDAYADDQGIMQMDLTVYAYDQYDLVDIATLDVGDTIVRHSGAVTVTSLSQDESGTFFINGGLDNGGFDLVTDDSCVFYEKGYNDAKNWYAVEAVTIRVSVDFEGKDYADLELGEVILYPGDFLVGQVTNYDFTPYNTTVRVEAGQIVELTRRYTP